MSDTPRTDEAKLDCNHYGCVSSGFACALERELNAAHDLLRQADDEIKALKADRDMTLAALSTPEGYSGVVSRAVSDELERVLNDLRHANATIQDWKDAADAAMQPNEHEQHCTCVGVLRARVRAIERDNARLLALATEATSAT